MGLTVRNPITGKKQDLTPRIDGGTGKNIVKNTVGIATGGLSSAAEGAYDKLVENPQKAAHDARRMEDERRQQAYDEFGNLQSPDFDLSDFQLGRVLDQSGTEFDKISTDPRLREAQLNALASLEKIGNSNGLLDADKALLAKTQRDAAMQDRGRREAILQNNAARGMAGTGNELLAQLSSSQAATDRSNQAGLDIAGMAQQRALDSIAKAGSLGGSIRGQDYDEQAKRAAAQDAINQFNAGQKTRGSFNNAGIKNDQLKYHNDLRQTGFENQHGIAKDKANVRLGQATTAGTRAKQQSATAGNNINTMVDLATKGVTAGWDYFNPPKK